MRRTIVYRWDIDKTYLVSNFESVTSLLRVPFQRGRDKVSLPGVVPLIHGLRAAAQASGDRPHLHFLSASPPQIGRAIRSKLSLDGIVYDGIRFKDQVRHLVRGDFDALREQIGYKLSSLLHDGRQTPSGARERLFGDDFESDPLTYSLYADVVAGRVDRDRVMRLLYRAGVDPFYCRSVSAALEDPLPGYRVDAICILRRRPRSPVDLGALGPRVVWFDDYFEAALRLYAMGMLLPAAALEVGRAATKDGQAVQTSYRAARNRGTAETAAAISLLRRGIGGIRGAASLASSAMPRVALARARTGLGLSPACTPDSAFVPDYEALIDDWAHRPGKEADDA